MNAGNFRFKLTWSSLWHILWLGGTRLQYAAEITILRVVLMLDVSRWQGIIDFVKMASEGVLGVIIKCGQGNDHDPNFLTNWAKAKTAGIPRGSYWFFDSRVPPKAQAAKWWDWVKADRGELMFWLDLEENYGGPYKGWQNWKIFLEEFMRLSGVPASKIGIYTGYYYWIANSPTNLADLNWFGQFWLWLAWYTTNPANVIIPKPWTQAQLLFWQYGTNGVDGKTPNGLRYGAESIEIDENNFNGDISLYQQLFGLGTVVIPPPEPPTGETMQYRIVWEKGANERTGPSTSDAWTGKTYLKDDIIEIVGDLIVKTIGYEVWGKLPNNKFVALIYSGTDRAVPVIPPPVGQKKVVKAVVQFDDATSVELFPQ